MSEADAPAEGLTPRLRRDPRLAIGAALLVVIMFVAVFAPALDSHGALDKNVMTGLGPLGAPLAPSAAYPFGTDILGRCEASRLFLGARLSLGIAIPAALISIVIGVVVGAVAGYAGGRADAALMRFVDFILSFPLILLTIALAAVLRESGAGAAPVLIVLSVSGWVTTARVVRAKVLALRELDFMLAARALGAGHLSILVGHVLPNLAGPIVVLATLLVGDMLLAESALSYLGIGAPPPTPSWGRMLSEGQSYLQGAPWLVMAPGMAILITVLACNLVGESLRDALDPKGGRLPVQAGKAT